MITQHLDASFFSTYHKVKNSVEIQDHISDLVLQSNPELMEMISY